MIIDKEMLESIRESERRSGAFVRESDRLALDRHRHFSSCGRFVYHISIIDYLTEFDFAK